MTDAGLHTYKNEKINVIKRMSLHIERLLMTDDGLQAYKKNEKMNVLKSEHTHIDGNND